MDDRGCEEGGGWYEDNVSERGGGDGGCDGDDCVDDCIDECGGGDDDRCECGCSDEAVWRSGLESTGCGIG